MTKPYLRRLEEGILYRLADLVKVHVKLDADLEIANDLKAAYNAHLASTTCHTTADAVNVITSADATDLASLIVLLNEAAADYEAHRILVGGGPVHGSADATHAITAPAAADLATADALLMDLARQWYLHRRDTSGTPAVHLAEDWDRFFWRYVEKVAHFGGGVEDIVAHKKTATAGSPFVLVQAQGGNPSRVDLAGRYYRPARVAVLLVDRNKAGDEEKRWGRDVALHPPGLYQMIEDVEDRLVNKQPVDGSGASVPGDQWKLVEDRLLHGDGDMQVWLITVESTACHQWPQVDRAALEDLGEAHGEGHLFEDGVEVRHALELTLDTWP